MFGPTVNIHQGVARGIFDYHLDTGNCGKCLYIILHQSSKCLWTLDPPPQNKVVVDLFKNRLLCTQHKQTVLGCTNQSGQSTSGDQRQLISLDLNSGKPSDCLISTGMLFQRSIVLRKQLCLRASDEGVLLERYVVTSLRS